MKILVFTPTYKRPDKSLAIWPDSAAAIQALDHGAHEVTFWLSVDRVENKKENVVKQYQKAHKRALADGFDAMMIVEHDIVVPPDALIKMAEVDAPVVYGVFLFRHGSPVLNTMRAVDNWIVDQSLQNFPTELAKARKAVVYPVSGLGFGCILIHREVLETIPFRSSEDNFYPDGPFAADCCKAHIQQMARFDVECGHIREDGFVLWPSVDPSLYDALDCKILQSFNGYVLDESKHYESGQTVKIPIEIAVQFQRAGFLSILVDQSLPPSGRLNKAIR